MTQATRGEPLYRGGKMTASARLQARLGAMATLEVAKLFDKTSRQQDHGQRDAEAREGIAALRRFLMDELDRRDPAILKAFLANGQKNMADGVK